MRSSDIASITEPEAGRSVICRARRRAAPVFEASEPLTLTAPLVGAKLRGPRVSMATTWVYERNGEQYFIQQHDGLDGITILTWGAGDQDATTVRTELEAAQLVAAIEAD